jgi:hypothetical protein
LIGIPHSSDSFFVAMPSSSLVYPS